jgi:uncharacterized protein YigE (DUF2233 family)
MQKIYWYIIMNKMNIIYLFLIWLFAVIPVYGQLDKPLPIEQVENPPDSVFTALKQSDTLSFRGQTFTYFLVNLDSQDIRFFWRDKAGENIHSLENLKWLADSTFERKLVFATNGGMYLSDFSPQGLYIEQGRMLKPADTLISGYGNFYLQPNGVFLVNQFQEAAVITTDSFRSLSAPERQSIKYATQSGPLVVHKGQINSVFTDGSRNLNIRSGVGVINKKELVFLISDQRVNFFDFATVFREKFDCSQALYLDGAISRAYIPTLGRYDTGGQFGVMIGVFK